MKWEAPCAEDLWTFGGNAASGKKACVFSLGTRERGRWSCSGAGGPEGPGAEKGAVLPC